MRRGKRNRRKTAFTVHSSKYSHGWLHLWSNCGQMTASQYRVLSKIVERRGGREKENIKKETEGRREKKKKKLSLLQVRLRIWWKREPPRIETFGVQWRIENCPRDEWNREIRSAFSKMRRKYRVSALSCPSHFLLPFLRRFHLCSSSGQCGTMKWPWRFAFSANPFSFRDRDRVFTSAPFNFFGTLFIRELGESIYSPMVYPLIPFSRAASCFWFFRIPGAKRHFTDIANRITSPLNVLRDHCWDSLLATNEIETFCKGTDSCIILLSISIRRKIFWNNKRMTYEGSFRFW